MGWEKFAIFDRYLSLSWKQYEIGPWLQWNNNRSHRQPIDQLWFQWYWVTLKCRTVGVKMFWRISIIMPKWFVWP